MSLLTLTTPVDNNTHLHMSASANRSLNVVQHQLPAIRARWEQDAQHAVGSATTCAHLRDMPTSARLQDLRRPAICVGPWPKPCVHKLVLILWQTLVMRMSSYTTKDSESLQGTQQPTDPCARVHDPTHSLPRPHISARSTSPLLVQCTWMHSGVRGAQRTCRPDLQKWKSPIGRAPRTPPELFT